MSLPADPRVLETVKKHWGFDELRPLQAEAIGAALAERDSLLVLPTGGGKSLTYQVPALVRQRLSVVVSPLISLMKDQVDGLRQSGVPAAAVHSGQTGAERRDVAEDVERGRLHLLFVSPERLVQPRFLDWLKSVDVGSFTIDEAHCISQWGHDFRPEYRMLASLREHFDVPFHACTATATPRVREDIVSQLHLRDPEVLVGSFDRPNLVYRVQPRDGVGAQVREILKRHDGEASIVYCITRKETEELAATLVASGVKAAAYHAGMSSEERHDVHDAFSAETIDVVVATVAFGMGIDRSNVRCIIHAAMPKSIEAYQQETGRAGRDGLEAECILLHSGQDGLKWDRLIRMSASDAEDPLEVTEAQIELLRHMQRFCVNLSCRHAALVRYFGQSLDGDSDNCGACDVCLGEVDGIDDSVVIAQKILSCVYRVGQRFGIGLVVDVVRGSDTEVVRRNGFDELSTFGLLSEHPKPHVNSWVYQLVDAGVLERTSGDRPTLHLNERSFEVMRGERDVQLAAPKRRRARKSKADVTSWEGVDQDVFETLRTVRRELAQERGVPAYVIFNDATLRELARYKPRTREELSGIKGIGAHKLDQFGALILETLEEAL